MPRVLQNKADKIPPTRRRGIADYKLNIALSGKITMEKHEKWRGDGIDLRLGCNSFNTYQESLDAAKACIRVMCPNTSRDSDTRRRRSTRDSPRTDATSSGSGPG